MKSHLTGLLFSVFLFCCSCGPLLEENPSPNGPFRIKSLKSDDASGHAIEYRYYDRFSLAEITERDASSNLLSKQKFHYDTEGRLSTMSHEFIQEPQSNFSKVYTYNENGIIHEVKEYSDISATTLKSTTTYYRQGYVQLSYYIVDKGSQRDSVVYTGYDRERPSGKWFFTISEGSDYSLMHKERYTYDEGFNLIQTERTEGSDTETFKLRTEQSYQVVRDFRTVFPNPQDNVFKEYSPDFPLHYKEYTYENCGTSVYENGTQILESNAYGLPVKIRRTFLRNYCSLTPTNGADVYTITYEVY